MRRVAFAAVVVLIAACYVQAEEAAVESRIVSVGMFKNGLALVKRTVSIPAPGTYALSDVPDPVHGTFWIESDAKVETRVTIREFQEPGRGESLYEELAGRKVIIHFRDGRIQPASGTVVSPKADGEKKWDRAYENFSRWWYGSSSRPSGRNLSDKQPRYLVMETERGRIYVEPSMIAYAQAEGEPAKVTRRRPVLLFNVTAMKEKPATILVTYLTKGMAWAPSYRVDISDPKELRIEQKAVIKNELEDIDGVELSLITGFPSVRFGHVTSPLSLRTPWTEFFRQLRTDPSTDRGRGWAVTGQAVMNVAAPGSGPIDLSAIPKGEGPDIYYHPIGPQTLAEGDSLALSVALGQASYERIVEWIVPDTRKVNGRYIDEREMRRDPKKYRDAAWDSVRFRNPLDFPMTTGPAMIVANGKFLGQSMSYFVNKGEQTMLHITKALSIRTRATEHEEPVAGNRETIYWGGQTFRKVPVKGELLVSNHRAETVTLVIRRRFSGELLEADGDPRCVLREEGVYSVNKRNELIWTFELKPGKEKKLAYRYSVLVRH